MEYWIAVDGQSSGPYELDFLLKNNKLQADTLVWREGMKEWLPASQVEELKSIFNVAYAPAVPPTVNAAEGAAPAKTTPSTSTVVEESYDDNVEPNYSFAGLPLSITLCAVSFVVWLIAICVGAFSTASASFYDEYYYDTTDVTILGLLFYVWPFLFGAAAIIMSVFSRKNDRKGNITRANVFAGKARLFNILNLVTLGVVVILLMLILS